MSSPLTSLIKSGTKLWLDSVDPELVKQSFAAGATGATSNPIIVADIVKTGKFDTELKAFARAGQSAEDIAWSLTNLLVTGAEQVFAPVFDRTRGDDGYVSFEVDPLLEDAACTLSLEAKRDRYIELGTRWAKGHPNRLVKVPATPGGLAAVEELCARGVNLNVTLIFSQRQYEAARAGVWRGAERRKDLTRFKSVYSIFVSRLDVYSEKAVPQLAETSQGLVGILNAKRIWRLNTDFWGLHATPLKQEMIFASTGTKSAKDKPWKYVEAFAGADIETNPPATNDAVEASGVMFSRKIDELPAAKIVADIDQHVNWGDLERALMEDGLKKFAEPHKALLQLIATKMK